MQQREISFKEKGYLPVFKINYLQHQIRKRKHKTQSKHDRSDDKLFKLKIQKDCIKGQPAGKEDPNAAASETSKEKEQF